MEKNNCKKKLVKLYSSVNFSNPTDTKEFYSMECNKCKKLKTLIHFLGEYNSINNPKIYFRAKILLSSNIITDGNSQKYNISITDICFKNEFNVSASSITDEYKYLYDISCSSADNHKSSNTASSISSSSSSVSSSCSSNLSLSEIINNGIEKQITNHVRDFIESDAFIINWVNDKGSYILDTVKYNNGNIFPNVKMTIKFKAYDCRSSSSCSSSSSSSSSSSHKSKKFIKLFIMGFICMFIIMILLKFISKIDICKYLTMDCIINNNEDNNDDNKIEDDVEDK